MSRIFARAPKRSEAVLAAIASLLLFLAAIPGVDARPRSFSTCSALDIGFDSDTIGRLEELESACSSVGDESASASFFVSASGDIPDDIRTAESVAVTSSSFDEISLRVIGGDRGSSTFEAERDVSTRVSDVRPEGPWYTVTAVSLRSSVESVWTRLSNSLTFFSVSLGGFGVTVEHRGGSSTFVDIRGSGGLTFVESNRDETDRFSIYTLTGISPRVFPGFDFEGSEIFIQVTARTGVFHGVDVEIGWRPKSTDVGGDLRLGTRIIESLLLEMLLNIERDFLQLCEFARNVRTIEGDCNNLSDPEKGTAGSPLRRLGGADPAYPGGDRSIPAGPLDINVRKISNKLFAMSPGAVILEPQLEQLRESCVTGETSYATFEVCPLEFVRVTGSDGTETEIQFDRIEENDCEEIVLVYESSTCEVNILLKCSGETVLDLAEDPCGADTNRLFSPVGCVINPGEDSVLANSDGLTDLFFSFGQFIDHDIGLSPLSQVNEEQPGFSRLSRGPPPPDVQEDFPIEIPDNDFHFEREEFEFTRASFSEQDPNSQVNLHSSYLDGSHIYGVNYRRSRLLRTFEGGKLTLSNGNLPPFNGAASLGATVENGPNTDSRFFVVGDVRGNEQTLLLSLHIIFIREHNRVADELYEAFPDFDDERLYQTARAIVIAEFQCIVYKEWLPLLLGPTSPNPRDFSYNEGLDVSASAIFTTAAFRFGHSMVGTNLLRIGPGRHSSAQMNLMPIRDVFFAPELVINNGVEPFLRGGAWHLCKEMDSKVVDELRNFLITEFDQSVANPPRFDLVSLNLQRGRDIGLPSFNDVRELYGLSRYTSFSEFVSDPSLANLAKDIYYDNVDVVDTFFGGTVEDHLPGSQLGETFNTIIAEQFIRFRDADRFFYTGIKFDRDLIRNIPVVQDIVKDNVRLADIIVRNSDVARSELGRKESVFQT